MPPDFETKNTDLKIEFYDMANEKLYECRAPAAPQAGDKVSFPSGTMWTVKGVGWLIDQDGHEKHVCVVVLQPHG